MSDRTALTIGNYDGVHRGHQALVHRAREHTGPNGRVIVLSFDPHPMTVLRPEMPAPARLSTFADRETWLEASGADDVVRLEPTEELLGSTPEAFIEQLVEKYAPTAIVEGPDFAFGRNRTGNLDLLRSLGNDHGFEVIVVDPVEVPLNDQIVVTASSSVTRWLLQQGRVADAAIVLDRHYRVRSRVSPGDQRGRTIGIPTANIRPEQVMPANGVYAGLATGEDGRTYPAAINVGTRPTFEGLECRCEVHLISYEGEIGRYGWSMMVEFTAFLRPEMKFASIEEIVAQIRRDIARVEAWAAVQC